jgi:NAD(P)H-quinone oxidoreductase subunit 5
MEAPTPVSALLHAGVVNLGGFVMIRLAPLMVRAEAAQAMLVVIGSVTAVVAALVMTTRVSVKVHLAWSTSAQMGFMLVQCGLGAHSLALLHLVGHSLYKAHAFLRSGSVVSSWRAPSVATRTPGLPDWFAAGAAGLLAVLAVGAGFGLDPRREPALWALTFILGLALTPLLAHGGRGGLRRTAGVALGASGAAALYFTWHALLGGIVAEDAAPGPGVFRILFVAASFAALFVVQGVLASRPGGRLARVLYPRLFAGLHLDEVFTRLTFRVWPPRLPSHDPVRRGAAVAPQEA